MLWAGGTWTALIVPIPILQEDLTALLLEYGPDKVGALLWSMKWSKKKSEEVEHRSPKAGDEDMKDISGEVAEREQNESRQPKWNRASINMVFTLPVNFKTKDKQPRG